MIMKTPEHVLVVIRQRFDLDEKDTSRDAEILGMTEDCGLKITKLEE
jgi:hypothetical protein